MHMRLNSKNQAGQHHAAWANIKKKLNRSNRFSGEGRHKMS